MDFNIESRIDCLCSVAEVKHGPLPMVAQAIISVDSCIAKRRPFCGFEKLKARRLLCGLCVLWKLHTKELQVKLYVHYTSYKLYVHYTSYKLYVHYTNIKTPTSTINSSLYHSKYRMNLIFFWGHDVPVVPVIPVLPVIPNRVSTCNTLFYRLYN